ncbi:MAG TPA: VOC family protein [Telluria sp.]|nr:VOC family protein [Telluria sp.]
MRLNHLDFPVPDVAATAAFFTSHLGFRLLDMRGRQALAILQGDDGFVLVLHRQAQDAAPPPPDWFHIGFLQDSEAAVLDIHARLRAVLPDLPEPARMRGALLFYFHAPGGVLVEISHRPRAA